MGATRRSGHDLVRFHRSRRRRFAPRPTQRAAGTWTERPGHPLTAHSYQICVIAAHASVALQALTVAATGRAPLPAEMGTRPAAVHCADQRARRVPRLHPARPGRRRRRCTDPGTTPSRRYRTTATHHTARPDRRVRGDRDLGGSQLRPTPSPCNAGSRPRRRCASTLRVSNVPSAQVADREQRSFCSAASV